jgi:hypothetical protein
VADSGEELLDLFAVACGTRDFLVPEDQDFKIFLTFGTVKLENGHLIVSLSLQAETSTDSPLDRLDRRLGFYDSACSLEGLTEACVDDVEHAFHLTT